MGHLGYKKTPNKILDTEAQGSFLVGNTLHITTHHCWRIKPCAYSCPGAGTWLATLYILPLIIVGELSPVQEQAPGLSPVSPGLCHGFFFIFAYFNPYPFTVINCNYEHDNYPGFCESFQGAEVNPGHAPTKPLKE